ncbi:MAG: hypothetical protein OXO51_00805 [Gemmatimonadota bacterium]|nr:hypothetical protein [Gemmatimonadota bacterium]
MSDYYTPTPVIPQGQYVEIDTIVETGTEGREQTPRRITVSIPVRHIHRMSEETEMLAIPVIEESSGA